MSNIDYLRKKIKPYIEVELAESLPIRNRNYEILFYYNTYKDGDNLVFGEVKYIFCITDEKEIICHKVSEIIKDKTKAKMKNAIIPILEMENVYPELEDEYEELYKVFCQLKFQENLDKANEIFIKKLNNIFLLLVPDSVLRDLYFSLGTDMFDYISTII